MDAIKRTGCDFRVYKLVNTGKNALDFYIASECGVLSQSGETELVIVSNDKGFNRQLHTGSLRLFGRRKGTEIYQILKTVV